MNTAKTFRPSPLRDLRGPTEINNAEILANKVRAVWAASDRPTFHLEMPLQPWLTKRRSR
jgi:hypothetical protein